MLTKTRTAVGWNGKSKRTAIAGTNRRLNQENGSAAALGFFSLTITVAIGMSSMFTRGDEPMQVELHLFPIILTIALWLLLGVCSIGHRLGKFGGVRLAWSTTVAFGAACGLLLSLGPQGVHGS